MRMPEPQTLYFLMERQGRDALTRGLHNKRSQWKRTGSAILLSIHGTLGEWVVVVGGGAGKMSTSPGH